MSFVRVASLTDIPTGRGKRVSVGDLSIGLYRIDDHVYAMEDVCPHAGYPLSIGRLEGCVISCAAHGWPFDVRTGFAPDNPDGFPIPCFAVRIRGDDVEVDVEQQTNDVRSMRRQQ